jgi:AcrR family transcriptional regulator
MMPRPEKAAGGRPKAEPDPQVRAAILAAAHDIVREDGVRALGIAQVLSRLQLGTRAFYRHFESKEQLVAAMFLEIARAERNRLQDAMAGAEPVRAVVAWIDARLDLAFDNNIQSDLQRLSLEAQSQIFASPELIAPAYAEILQPLVDQIAAGAREGSFVDVDAAAEGLSIHGVVWASVETQWFTAIADPTAIRTRVQRFCLRGLGVAPGTIADVLSAGRRQT